MFAIAIGTLIYLFIGFAILCWEAWHCEWTREEWAKDPIALPLVMMVCWPLFVAYVWSEHRNRD